MNDPLGKVIRMQVTGLLCDDHGGGMDSAQFSAILQGSINSFCIVGAVLLFIGGLGCMISIVFLEMQKTMEDE